MIAGLALGALLLGATGDAQTAALGTLAERISEQVVQSAPDAPVAVVISGGPEREALFSLMAARLAQAHLAPAEVRCTSNCDDLALASGARTLVRLVFTPDAKAWRVDGELHGVWRNFWAGQRPIRPSRPAAALHASVPMSPAEVPIAASTERVLRSRELTVVDGGVEAILGVDLDGDGTDELLALTDDALLAFDAAGRRVARHPLDGLPAAAEVSRDPLGALAVEPSPLRVLAFSQNRAQGERLAWDQTTRTFQSVDVLNTPRLGCGAEGFDVTFTPGENTFEPTRLPKPLPRSAARTSALACRFTPNGGEVLWVLPDGSGRVSGPGGGRALSGVGAGAGLVDVDGDGVPEVVTSTPLLSPDPDQLTVSRASGTPETLPLPGRILLVAPLRMAGHPGEVIAVARRLPDGRTALSLVEEVTP